MKRIILYIVLTVITLILGGCLPGIFPPTPPTPSPTPPVDNATLFGIAIKDISDGQVQYLEYETVPTDPNLIEELNKILAKRVYKEVFTTTIEVINVTWLKISGTSDEDVLIMINCYGQHEGDCNVRKTTSEIIFILQWLPVEQSSLSHSGGGTENGKFWAFPLNTRYIFFYTCDTKKRQGFIKIRGDYLNAYLNGRLPGESLSTYAQITQLP